MAAGLLGQGGCRKVDLRDGFACSATGTCPSPYKCAADMKCYRTPPGGDAATAGDAAIASDTAVSGDAATAGDGGEKDTGGTDTAAGDDVNGAADTSIPPSGVETGGACSAATDCKSTFCVDGVCCAAACTGSCMACAESYTGKPSGTCAPVNEGMDPHDSCAAMTAESCGNDGMCDGKGACRKHGSSQSCAAAACMGTKFVSSRSCDGAGACAPARTMECGTTACTTSGCALPCTTDPECGTGAYCVAGTCKVKGANGEACGGTNQCLSGFCVDGFCCDGKCDGKCSACANAKTGQANGKCSSIPTGSDPDNECASDATKPCGLDGFCNGAGACRMPALNAPCGTATCSGSTLTPGGMCDGAGMCNPGSPRACTGGLTCVANSNACKTTCSTDSDCANPSANYCLNGACSPKKAGGATCNTAAECTTGFCSADKHCCNSACSAAGCQACTTGTCTTTANTATDPNNCGSCGTKCSSKITSHGAPKCAAGTCVEACAAGYMLCNDSPHSCISSVFDFEASPSHIPGTCGPYGSRYSATHHGGTTGIELQGMGTGPATDPSRVDPECLTFQPQDFQPSPPGCSFFFNTAGATVSVWFMAPDWQAYAPSCWLFTDAGNSAKRNVTTKGMWTQLSWVLPASLLSAAQIKVMCDVPDAEYYYLDDFSITPAQ